MILRDCCKQTRNEVYRLLNKAAFEIYKVECDRNKDKKVIGFNGKFSILPRYIQDMLVLTMNTGSKISRQRKNEIYIPDEVVEFIYDYEMVDFYDELEEMQYYGKFKIVK